MEGPRRFQGRFTARGGQPCSEVQQGEAKAIVIQGTMEITQETTDGCYKYATSDGRKIGKTFLKCM